MEFLVLLTIYFIPSVVAMVRKHKQEGAITMLNLFLGWTFIGWVIAIVWASTSDVKGVKNA